MKRFEILVFILLASCQLTAQSIDKLIREKEVSRILQTLSADAMMGRPADSPELIEPAARFLEAEFKSIGLGRLQGLAGYRQEFTKTRIKTGELDVTIDEKPVSREDLMLISEKTALSRKDGMKVVRLAADTTARNRMAPFLGKLRELFRDTTATLVLVDEYYRQEFSRLRGFYSERFTTGIPGTCILIIGKSKADNYSVRFHQIERQIAMANIVGVIKGKSKPEEMVIFSSHYDHIGIQTPVEGDSIANGADDDATGTTAVISLARYFMKSGEPERTLVFVAFTAEEIGGFGSRWFSEKVDPAKSVAMFNIEMIGKPSKFGKNSAFITGFEKSDFGEILQRNLAGTSYTFHPDPYPEQNLFYRSDNATLARLGVPAHTISTDQIDSDKLYHTVNDEFDSMDIQNVTSTIRAIALSAKGIVSGKDTPTRIKEEK